MEVRQQAISEREARLLRLRQRRDELLRQAWSLTKDVTEPERFGAGRLIGENEADDEALAFVKRFEVDGDDLRNALPTTLPELPATPPAESPASVNSEAIAADLVPHTSSSDPVDEEVEKPVEAPAAKPIAIDAPADKAAEPEAAPSAIILPRPRTPPPSASLPTLVIQSPTAPPQLPATIDPSLLFNQPTDQIPPAAKRSDSHHLNMLDTYAERLPPLPDDVLRQRLLVGGLYRKKQKEKDRSSGSSVGMTGGTDLFRLGISKAQNMSVRNWMGVGPLERPNPAARTGKVLLTRDWNVGYQELKTLRAMERIEQAKAEGNWSLRQIKKQKGPVIPKAHRDYMLEEMRWLRTDFREERKWKLATAMMLASCVQEWHQADAEGRKALQVQVRPASEINHEVGMAVDDEEDLAPGPDEAVVLVETIEDADDAENMAVDAEIKPEIGGDLVDPLPFAPASSERPPPSPISQQELYPLRAPLFQMPLTTTVVGLEELPVTEMLAGTSEIMSQQLLSLLTPDLPLYEGLQPIAEGRVDRRYDESTPHHSRITPATHISQSKPLLLSTLEPAKKRRRLDTWNDMGDLLGMERSELESKAENLPIGSTLFAGRKPKEVSHAIAIIPPNYPKDVDLEARAAALDWTEQDDQTILKMSREYSYNWRLIAEIFNSQTFRVSTDKRLEWDIYDRWNRKFGPGSNQPSVPPSAAPSSDPAPPAGPVANKPVIKVKKVVGKYDGPRRKLHQNALHDAIRRLQKNREKNYKPPPPAYAPRKINLNAHDTHNVVTRPTMTPLEFSMFKAEIDRERALRQAAVLQQQQQQQKAALLARYPQFAEQQRAAQQQAAARAAGQSPASQPARPPSAAGSTASAGAAGSPHIPGAQIPNAANTASPRPSWNDLPLESQQQLLVDRATKLRAAGQGDSDQARAIAERLRLVQSQLLAQAQIAQAAANAPPAEVPTA